MEAAFDASDDEDDVNAESRPLNPLNTSPVGHGNNDGAHDINTNNPGSHPLSGRPLQPRPAHSRRQSTAAPGTYDFEADDYDFPPPGSPPPRDRALPNNDWGNSNGVIPTGPAARPRSNRGAWVRGPGFEWARRVLPGRVADRLIGSRREDRRRVVGGGIGNDGVFANVTAKPSLPRPIVAEDGVHVMPEETQKDAPPSYAAAQADAVPPYWETTVHAPSSLSPGMMVPGELPIDGLATGTLFSFAWNMLVSISFQFVGFLLTYLLHTTHAAKLGARAGLGLTLVQYGFALRTGKDDEGVGANGEESLWGGWGNPDDAVPSPTPTFDTAAAAESWAAAHNGTVPGIDATAATTIGADWTTEWLSFVLMTMGWFILLNSLLSFWRIKRWEKSILASHQENPDRPPPMPVTTPTNGSGRGHARQSSFALHFERTLGLRLPTAQMFRVGLGLSHWGNGSTDGEPRGGGPYVFDEAQEDLEMAVERESMEAGHGEEDELLLDIPPDHPDRARLIAEAYANERRLQEDLRAAGLL